MPKQIKPENVCSDCGNAIYIHSCITCIKLHKKQSVETSKKWAKNNPKKLRDIQSKYNNSEKGKQTREEHKKTEAFKEASKRASDKYRKSQHAQDRMSKMRRSPEFKKKRKEYNKTYYKTEGCKKSREKWWKSENAKKAKKEYSKSLAGKEVSKRASINYLKTEQGQENRKKIMSGRRELGFVSIMSNPFPKDITIEYHHIDNIFTIPTIKKTHQSTFTSIRNNHRVKMNSILEDWGFLIGFEDVFT